MSALVEWSLSSTGTIMTVVVGASALAAIGFVAVMDRLDQWAGE